MCMVLMPIRAKREYTCARCERQRTGAFGGEAAVGIGMQLACVGRRTHGLVTCRSDVYIYTRAQKSVDICTHFLYTSAQACRLAAERHSEERHDGRDG